MPILKTQGCDGRKKDFLLEALGFCSVNQHVILDSLLPLSINFLISNGNIK